MKRLSPLASPYLIRILKYLSALFSRHNNPFGVHRLQAVVSDPECRECVVGTYGVQYEHQYAIEQPK